MIIGTGLGIIASLWFYLWTNFGVWALDSFGMYPKTLLGLIDAYILGLPFFKNNLIGNLLFVPISLTIVELIYQKIGNIIIYGKKLKKYEWSK